MPSRILQQALLPVPSNQDCENKNGKEILDSMVCGGGTPDSGCHGDKGGPFVCKVNNRWEVHGVVGFDYDDCDSNNEKFTVFARVAKFYSWIVSHTESKCLLS